MYKKKWVRCEKDEWNGEFKEWIKEPRINIGTYRNGEARLGSEAPWKLWGNEIHNQRNDLKELQESFEIEREKLKGYVREIEVTVSYFPFLSSIKCFFRTELIGKGGGNVGMMCL